MLKLLSVLVMNPWKNLLALMRMMVWQFNLMMVKHRAILMNKEVVTMVTVVKVSDYDTGNEIVLHNVLMIKYNHDGGYVNIFRHKEPIVTVPLDGSFELKF